MPRFSYPKDKTQKKEMSTSRPTPSRKSSDGKRRSAPTPSSSKKDATAKTPASILKTSRRGIKVTRTEKASDGYADDSPYWAAAKLASTQPTNDDDDDSSSEESMNSTEKRQLEKKAKRDQKKIQKKKETLEQRRKLKQKYMDGQAKVKPNFKGAESDDGEDSSRASGDEKMNGDSTQNGEWLKETLDEKRKSKNMFSPSDLSRASTIPPTPASTKTAKSANSLGDLNISVDMDGNDDANEFHVSYDNEDDDVGENSENDNDQPLASSLSPIHEEEHVAGERKQYGLEDKIEDIIETIEPQTPAKSMQANDNDNDSDGGYDEGPGFELNDDMPSPPAPSPPQSDNEEDKSSEKLLLPTLRSSPRSSSKKRSRTESVEDSDSEDSKKAEKARKEKKKKSKRGRPRKKKVNFSQGYQTGPREYRTIPAEEFEGEDGPAGVRRSKRRKFEPLQFWKNEKIVYEANRDDDDDAEIFGDMPMVTGIQKAEPTPYKKRSITRRVESDDESAATGKKSRKKSSSVSQEDAPFDCSKLRKKVNIIDGDKGFVWNEHSSSAEEMSKLFMLLCYSDQPLPKCSSSLFIIHFFIPYPL